MVPQGQAQTEVTALDPLMRFSTSPWRKELRRSHELLDDAVESRALVSEAFLTSSKGTEVLDGPGYGLQIS